MAGFSSEAKAAGLQEPPAVPDAMTEEELKLFRASFDPDRMGFDGAEGIDDEKEGDGQNGSEETKDPQADLKD